MTSNRLLPLMAILTCALAPACLLPASADETTDKLFDKSLLVGVWLAPNARLTPGDTRARMEFMRDGRFRTINQIGEEIEGRWKWNGPNTISIIYPGTEPAVLAKIQDLTTKKLVIFSRGSRSTGYLRIDSWDAKGRGKPTSIGRSARSSR